MTLYRKRFGKNQRHHALSPAHYNNAGKPDLYGKHIWKGEILHYLKRARQAGDAPLHKKTVTLTFTAADRLSCNPVDWVLAVLAACGGDAYTLEKRKYVDSVGYETETHTGNFELGPLKTHAGVVMHEIGLLADLPVTNFKLFDTRFGIKASAPLQEMTDGRVRFTQEGRPVTVKLGSSKGDEIELPGLAWAPSMIPLEHPEFRIRVQAGHIDIVFKPGDIVKFTPIDRPTYDRMIEEVDSGTFNLNIREVTFDLDEFLADPVAYNRNLLGESA